MEDKLFRLYTLAIMNYEKKFVSRVNNIEELYPKKWNDDKDYKVKINIIGEAIKNNILIKDTKLYQDYIIDVKE